MLSRYGGEEFAIICRDTDSMEASILGERIRHEVAAFCFTAEERQLKLTVSIGIAALPEASIKTPEALVLAADEALYQAKDRGRNCVITKRSHD